MRHCSTTARATSTPHPQRALAAAARPSSPRPPGQPAPTPPHERGRGHPAYGGRGGEPNAGAACVAKPPLSSAWCAFVAPESLRLPCTPLLPCLPPPRPLIPHDPLTPPFCRPPYTSASLTPPRPASATPIPPPVSRIPSMGVSETPGVFRARPAACRLPVFPAFAS